MSKCQAAKKMIRELLADGMVHTIEEMTLLALERQIIKDEKDNAVKNAVYQMKMADPSIVNVKRGAYQMKTKKDDYTEQKDLIGESISHIIIEVKRLKQFDWVNCTNEELIEARNEVLQLTKLHEEIKAFLK